MHTFPSYKQSDLIQLSFIEVMNLYDRAIEILSGNDSKEIDDSNAAIGADDVEFTKDENGNWI